jgi:hypothetical protein
MPEKGLMGSRELGCAAAVLSVGIDAGIPKIDVSPSAAFSLRNGVGNEEACLLLSRNPVRDCLSVDAFMGLDSKYFASSG